jgi:dolichol-phosphate mannosyltransferase
MKVSLVIPVFNEEAVLEVSLPILYATLESLISLELCNSFEMLLVDDGSTDNTLKKIRIFRDSLSASQLENEIRIIKMLSNHGHMKAIEAGIRESDGDCIITIDADLQDPPEAIIEMIRIFNDTSISCVQTFRETRETDSLFKRISANIFYKIIRLFTGVSVVPHAADFRLLSKKEAKMIVDLPEEKKIFRLLIPYLNIPTQTLAIERKNRAAGESKYTLMKMIKLALDSALGFSIKPLRLIMYLAIFSTLMFFLIAMNAIRVWLSGSAVQGWTSITLVVLFGYATTSMALATIGEYVGRIYFHMLGRPAMFYSEILD